MPAYSRLSPSSSRSPTSITSSRMKPIHLTDCDKFGPSGREKPPIQIDDKVVWMSDDGPEFGTVKWIGILPDQGEHWMAGVHFDNPIGTGLGEYNGFQLFKTPLRHASLVPLIGLLKAEDFKTSEDTSSGSPKSYIPTKSSPRLSRGSYSTSGSSPKSIRTSGSSPKFADSDSEIYGDRPSRPPRSKAKQKQETYKFYTTEESDIPSVIDERISQTLVHANVDDEPGCGYAASGSVASTSSGATLDSKYFGGIECPTVMGHVNSITTRDGFEKLLGKNRAIQGHHNSCYLDATLFSMFASSTVFDSLLNRPPRKDDIPEYSEVQKILKEEIVNPLRANYYVRADRVMKLRHMLEKISSMRGLTSEEKDPEEFLDMLLTEVLKAEPYLKFSTGLNSFCYQLFVEKDDNIKLPTVQQLFEQSFFNSNLKLKEIPPCLILQMPRFGRQFKTYAKIMPTMYLDITNVLDNSPRQCIMCGDLADIECRDCFGQHDQKDKHDQSSLESVTYCFRCFEIYHSKATARDNHQFEQLKVPESFRRLRKHSGIPRVMMELFAVLCIETSHYVSFVKCGSQKNAPWCFFDSMADRRGGQNGYNIPEVSPFDDMDHWMTEDGKTIMQQSIEDKSLPEFPRRLFSDAYICFYSSEVQCYR